MSELAVDIRDVHKTYGKKIRALQGVSLQVHGGEIFGLLGANGAGKSTLVKVLMTVIRADRVEGTMLGQRIGDRKTLARIGYLPESHRFPTYLNAGQLLHYYAALAGVSRQDRITRAARWLDVVGLSDWAKTKISKYSKGMLQRLGIAQTMMNDPDLVLLDEPTDGLDPMGRRDVRELLVELRQQKKTVFLNSHLLGEVEMVCDRAAILASGNVVRQGTMSELTHDKVEVRITVNGDLTSLKDAIAQQGGAIREGAILLNSDEAAKTNAMIDLLRQHGMMIQAIVPKRVSLEDVFIEAVGQAKPGGVVGQAKPVTPPNLQANPHANPQGR